MAAGPPLEHVNGQQQHKGNDQHDHCECGGFANLEAIDLAHDERLQIELAA